MKQVLETPEAYHHRGAGGVVVSSLTPDALVALLHRTNGEWTLPKGHIEGDESSQEAALREIAEEIGLQKLEIVGDLGTIRYTFQDPDTSKPHHKEVIFYLVLSPPGCLPLTPEDTPKFDDARWMSLHDAEHLCTYDTTRKILHRARKALQNPLPRREF